MDIENALHHYANKFIVQESTSEYNKIYEMCDRNNQNWRTAFPTSAATPTVGTPVPSPTEPGVDAYDGGEDSFETNNQVEGVDEADIAKSDGVHVFAAYGDILYVWNAIDGTSGVSITKMPYNDTANENCESSSGWRWPTSSPTLSPKPTSSSRPTFMVTPFPTTPPPTEGPPTFSPAPSSKRTPFPTDGRFSCPATRSRKLQRHRRKTWSHCQQPKPRILSLLLDEDRLTAIVAEDRNWWDYSGDSEDVISDYTKLTVRVYDTSTVPTDRSPLRLLGEKEIKGDYNTARSVGSTGYVITTSQIKTHLLNQDLYRSQPQYCGLNSSEYEVLASEIARNATTHFMERMVNELQLQLDDNACESIFQVRAFQAGDNDEDKTNGDLLQQFVSVLKFDMDSLPGDISIDAAPAEIAVDVAGAFSSGYLNSVYASQKLITTQNVGSSYNSSSGTWDDSTFILGFHMSGETPQPFAYAEVPGTPLNQYSIDYFDGHLRVVTTELEVWTEADEWTSRPTNKIFVLKVPDPSDNGGREMELVGESAHLGKPNESVFAVRFMGAHAYIVTFERIDPFLIYDLSDPTKPEELGELEIPGFSNYLHPVNIDGVSMMLGLGEHVDPRTQCRVGVKISLFNISDLENPTESATFVDEGAYSSVGYDFKSFRYLPLSKKLIFPRSKYK
ncbi:hypothetical protein ACHAWF_006448 [Thalassiosira exigua]